MRSKFGNLAQPSKTRRVYDFLPSPYGPYVRFSDASGQLVLASLQYTPAAMQLIFTAVRSWRAASTGSRRETCRMPTIRD